MLRVFLLTAVLLAMLSIVDDASAQNLEEIVVTGSRISSFEDDTVPVVHLKRRPDFMVVSAYGESDSRDRDLRLSEVRKTLQSVSKQAAKTANIELGLLRVFETDNNEIEFVVPFDLNDSKVTSGYRSDTSRVELVIKSPILETDDDPEKIFERIEAFMDSVRVTGRAVVADSGDPNYSLVNISQYRETLLRMIAADNESLRAIFGQQYQVSILGLEEPMRWRVTGPMELSIYFPYMSSLMVD